MAIILSGHGFKYEDEPYFRLPKGFKIAFWTRDGLVIRDRVAGLVEHHPDGADLSLASDIFEAGSLCPNYILVDPNMNPMKPLDVRSSPKKHIQLVPKSKEYIPLSQILKFYEHKRMGNAQNPVLVHWCASRSTEKNNLGSALSIGLATL
nr:hypothetical protein [uncultured Moellerella sp.]